jgi:hypothetical protein
VLPRMVGVRRPQTPTRASQDPQLRSRANVSELCWLLRLGRRSVANHGERERMCDECAMNSRTVERTPPSSDSLCER